MAKKYGGVHFHLKKNWTLFAFTELCLAKIKMKQCSQKLVLETMKIIMIIYNMANFDLREYCH